MTRSIFTTNLRGVASMPLAGAPPLTRASVIRCCGNGLFITTGDGIETAYWEKNVGLKIDGAETAPAPGAAAVFGAGVQGDGASVAFASLVDVAMLVTEPCERPATTNLMR